jgi:hypothetical protein
MTPHSVQDREKHERKLKKAEKPAVRLENKNHTYGTIAVPSKERQ